MKYTKEDFSKLTAEVINDLMQPTEDGNSLPPIAILLFTMLGAKLNHKLFENEEEIEIINTED